MRNHQPRHPCRPPRRHINRIVAVQGQQVTLLRPLPWSIRDLAWKPAIHRSLARRLGGVESLTLQFPWSAYSGSGAGRNAISIAGAVVADQAAAQQLHAPRLAPVPVRGTSGDGFPPPCPLVCRPTHTAGMTQSWVRDVEIVNADNGIQVLDSSAVTISQVGMRVTASRGGVQGSTGLKVVNSWDVLLTSNK